MTIYKHLPAYPAERALKVIAGRWKPLLLYRLYEGPRKPAAMLADLPGLSQKVLFQQLREMEHHGLIVREGVGARVSYQATDLGRSLEPVLLVLCAWGRAHAEALDEAERLACTAPVAAHELATTVS